MPVAQLAQDVFAAPLDRTGNRLLIRRVPGDRLRVKLAHDSVIFSAGEVAEIEVEPHLLPAGIGGKVLLVAQLFAARTSRDPLWGNERELNLTADGFATEPAILPVKLPEAEGVYDLRIAIHRRALQNRLGWKQTVEERKLQLIVLAAKRPQPAGAAPFPVVAETLFELDPASPRWWERLGNVPLIPGMRRGPLGNGDATPLEHPLGQLIQIGPGGPRTECKLGGIPAAGGPTGTASHRRSRISDRRRPDVRRQRRRAEHLGQGHADRHRCRSLPARRGNEPRARIGEASRHFLAAHEDPPATGHKSARGISRGLRQDTCDWPQGVSRLQPGA